MHQRQIMGQLFLLSFFSSIKQEQLHIAIYLQCCRYLGALQEDRCRLTRAGVVLSWPLVHQEMQQCAWQALGRSGVRPMRELGVCQPVSVKVARNKASKKGDVMQPRLDTIKNIHLLLSRQQGPGRLLCSKQSDQVHRGGNLLLGLSLGKWRHNYVRQQTAGW